MRLSFGGVRVRASRSEGWLEVRWVGGRPTNVNGGPFFSPPTVFCLNFDHFLCIEKHFVDNMYILVDRGRRHKQPLAVVTKKQNKPDW